MSASADPPAGPGPAPRPPATGPRFQPTRRRKRGRLAFGLLLLAAGGTVVWSQLRPRPVVVTPVVRGTAIDAVYATATVEAFDRVTVKAKLAGAIRALEVREGSTVRKGDLLAVIDSPALRHQLEKGKVDRWAAELQAAPASPQLAMIEAQVRMTEASLKNAREERDRLRKLAASGAATRADLDRAENNHAVLEAQLDSQRAQARSLRIELTARSSGSKAAVSELAARLADAEVRAPIGGVVLVRLVEPGEVVPQNGPLFRIGDVSKLVLECAVDEADIGRLTVGKRAAVSLYAFPRQVFRGEVFEILPDADRAKKSFLVKVRLLDAPAGLRSGMSGEVNLLVDEHGGALLAPAEAFDGANAVWVVRSGRVERRTPEIGVRDMLRVEVRSGLEEGDPVVVSGMEGLQAGARVTVTVQAANPKAVPPRAPAGGASL